ncbi:MAG: nicotinate phosphoribosyltransferase [Parcubacteria group bacterium]|nr:nicotinate phosphoribosyltransferase [Parcubacteria group bacterium]
MDARLDYFETKPDGNPYLKPESLLDVDLYKFTMGQWILINGYGNVPVTFELIIRDPKVKLAKVIPENELHDALDRKRDLRYLPIEIKFLRDMQADGKNVFGERYLQFLERFQLPPYELKREGDQYRLTFTGKWVEVTMWETIALSVVSELYYKNLMKGLTVDEWVNAMTRAGSKLHRKFDILSRYPNLFWSDFSHRRRHSFKWQKFAVGSAIQAMPKQFVGTSNVWMAFYYGIPAVGTVAHEVFMALAALSGPGGERRDSQYRALARWHELYGPQFRIFLADTYRTPEFLKHAPAWIAQESRGFRLDSGDPSVGGNLHIDWFKKHGVDPREKVGVFSDGLDVSDMTRLHQEFGGRIIDRYGWGTLFGNDFRGCVPPLPDFGPFSMACKLVLVAGRPAVKLSDNRGKETGPKREIERYKGDFGVQDFDTQPTV